MPAFAAMYKAKAAQLKTAIQNKYWDAGKKLYADTEDKQLFSQHTNSIAVLAGMVNNAAAHDISFKTIE
jgi:alpha-L-rhamnosidase